MVQHYKASNSRELLASSGLMGFMEGALLPEARESKIQLKEVTFDKGCSHVA